MISNVELAEGRRSFISGGVATCDAHYTFIVDLKAWVLQQLWKSQYTSCRVVLQNLPCADLAVRISGNSQVADFSVLARSVVAIFIDYMR